MKRIGIIDSWTVCLMNSLAGDGTEKLKRQRVAGDAMFQTPDSQS